MPANREREMQKAMKMAQLFNDPWFDQIVKILESSDTIDAKERNLKDVLKDSPLTGREKNWLCNYLKHYDPAIDVSPTW